MSFGGSAATQGTTLIEAAIITPLLFMLTFALIDFASMMYVYLALENGVSLATRYAVTGNVETPPSGPPLSREDSIIYAMRQATPTLTINSADITFSSMAPGGAGFSGGVGGPNDIVKVTVNYDHYITDAAAPCPVLPEREDPFHSGFNDEERTAVPVMTHSGLILLMKRKTIHGQNGTSLIEFSLVLPLIIILLLGMMEVSFALLDQHIVTKLTREGSNLISRDTDLPTAANVLKGMSTRPVNFDDGTSKVIFSVIKNVSTTTATNYNQPVLYARYVMRQLHGFDVS